MRIALIAMSGIRVCDQELLALGLTLPGFVERSKVIASLPSLGLLTLAGMTPKHHALTYLEIADLAALENLPVGFDLIAISSYSAQMNEAYELADRYRKIGVPVILGGLHASAVPEEAKAHCDSVVIGEGEVVWNDVLRDVENNSLQPFYGSRQGGFDLGDAPLPAYHLLDIEKYNRLTVQTSRGCPHRCEFCASSPLISRNYKQKPVEKVLAEIDAIRDIWPKPFIEFADDNSVVNTAYWKELLSALKSRHVRWFAETDIAVANQPSLLSLMREAGCAQLLVGFESPTGPPLDGIELKANWKLKQWKKYKRAVEEIQSHGISVNGCFILGLDGHSSDIFDALFDYVDELRLHEVQVTLQTPFPGTPLYDRLAAEKRLIEPQAWNKLTLFDVNFIPRDMSVDELSVGFRNLVSRLYSDDFTRVRRQRFREFLRERRKDEKEKSQ